MIAAFSRARMISKPFGAEFGPALFARSHRSRTIDAAQ
jgi:hypothetical protein